MMREEMEKLRDEMRANALEPSTSNRGRNQGDQRQSMQFTRFMRLLGSDTVPWLVYRGAILQRFRNSFDDPLAEAISFYMAGLPTDVELAVRITSINSHKPLALPTPNANWRIKPSTSQSTPFRRRLTQKELEEKRAKNQFFYCDQKYSPGHKCTGQVYLSEVVAEPDELDSEEEILIGASENGEKYEQIWEELP
ncbi:hypothetical protein Tco_1114479 [Tanacetum coccineum]|uniref:Uncharacterized protein n=1 Tax=Tanacetum coccineum TaxID=301880 RepID=A0ABQ5IVM5_9ASTR